MKLVNISFQPEHVTFRGLFSVKSLKTSLTVSKFYLKLRKLKKIAKITCFSKSLHNNTWSTIDPVMLVNISFQPKHVIYRGSSFNEMSQYLFISVKILFEITGGRKSGKSRTFNNL